jgi:hypothetical protein
MSRAPIATKKQIEAQFNRVWRVLQMPFTRAEFDEVSDIGSRTVERVFGGWTKAVEELGFADKFKKMKDVEAEAKSFNPDIEAQKRWEKEKEALVARAQDRKDKWLRESAYKLDLLKEILDTSIAKVEPNIIEVNPVKPYDLSASAGHKSLWFEFSDLQLGTSITSAESGGLNKHNWLVWQQKLKIWTQKVIERIALHSAQSKIDYVIIAGLGDFVEGQDIFAGQQWQIDSDVSDQAIYGARDTAGAFAEIFLTFPHIKFRVLEVFGNHGRVGKKGESPYSCSWDKIYCRFVQAQLKSNQAIKNFMWLENSAWFAFVELYGFNHLLLHGDQGVSGIWSGRPTINGLEKGVVRYNQMLQNQVHYCHVGHFHQEASLTLNSSRMLINGSFIGTSTFSARQMVAASPPEQTMHVFDPVDGLVQTDHLYLTDTGVINPIDPRDLG